NEQIDNIQKQYGKLKPQTEITKDSEVSGIYTNEEKEIENSVTLTLDKFKAKATEKKFIGAKVGDVITLKTKGLYSDDHEFMHALKLGHDEIHDLDIDRKSTRLNSSHVKISYAVFCLKKKTTKR